MKKAILSIKSRVQVKGIAIKLAVLFLIVLIVGCSTVGLSREQEIRDDVATMFIKGWNRGEVEVFDELLADRVLFHYGGSTREVTRDMLAQGVLRWRQAFPDLSMNIEKMVVDGAYASVRMTFTGTHRGTWAGAAPTGNRVGMDLMMFFRFEEGKLAEIWEVDDQLNFRKQLGL